MTLPYFVFKGIDSLDYLVVNKLPPIFKAERDMELIPVQGRDGFLTNDLGTYRSVIKPVECTISDLSSIDYICNWLDGSGEVTFSNEPDRIYKAVIKNQIQFDKILEEYRSFIIQFECQPSKYTITNDIITLTTSPVNVNNATTKISRPIIKVYGSGTIDLTINSRTIHLTNIVDYVTIDSYIVSAYKDLDSMNNDMTGEFPQLTTGINNLSWVGNVSKIEITPNWRY